jgi:hypothetical protein
VFWRLTPWQYKCCVESANKRRADEHDHAAWLMWHNAALPKMKEFKPLSAFLSSAHKPKAVTGIDEAAIMARMKAYNKRRAEQ